MCVNNGLIIIVSVLRIRRSIQGTKVNVKKTIIFSAYFVAITSFLVYNSFLIGNVAVLFVIPYFAVVIVTIYYSYIYSKRSLSFLKLPDSSMTRSVGMMCRFLPCDQRHLHLQSRIPQHGLRQYHIHNFL
jgi:hypothetical protein